MFLGIKALVAQYKLYFGIALVGLIIYGVYYFYNFAYDAGYDKRDLEVKKEYVIQLENLKIKAEDLQKDLNNIDVEHTARLKEKQDEIDKLRSGVGNGTIGLRVPVVCKTPTVSFSESSTASPGVDIAGTGELAESARQDYFALREGIAFQYEQLNACQDILVKEREVK